MNSLAFFPYCPRPPDWNIDWPNIESELAEWVEPMKNTDQDGQWHGEGDVWTHTRMVAEVLATLNDWRNRPETDRNVLFLAALLHDMGKPVCTKTENGRVVSPKHGLKGASLARKLLWTQFDLSGDVGKIELRERIVSMIRLHSLPYRLIDRADPLREVVRASQLLRNDELTTLATADLLGRIFEQKEKSLENIDFFRQFAAENRCMAEPFPFASDRSRFAYFNGTLEHPLQEIFDDTWGEVVLMSGLPASGKDYYIAEHFGNRPVVSLDEIRKELGVDWTDKQAAVVQTAKDRARDFLRTKTPFVWNATNLSREVRSSLIRLFSSYNARVRIVYVETGPATLLQRNRERRKPVSEPAIFSMFDKLEFPTVLEADRLDIVAKN